MSTPSLLVPGTTFSTLQDAVAAVAAFRSYEPTYVVVDGVVFLLDHPEQLQFIGFAGPFVDLVTGWKEPIVVRDDDDNPTCVIDPWAAHREEEQRRQAKSSSDDETAVDRA